MRSIFSDRLPSTALILRGDDASERVRMAMNSKLKDAPFAVVGGDGDPALGWEFNLDGSGERELWVEYASSGASPVRIELNGDPVLSRALAETTMGNRPKHRAWAYQATLMFRDGGNRLRILPDDGGPYIWSAALLPPGEALPSVDDRRAEPIPAPAMIIEDETLCDFVRQVTPAVRALIARGAVVDDVAAVVRQAAEAAARDMREPQQRVGFSGPLNGQIVRQAIFTSLDRLLHFDVFLETGSYLATTTEMFASYLRPVFSCENTPEFYHRSMSRLAHLPNVTLLAKDSRSFLRHFNARYAKDFSMPFAYLDAHWYDDLPLPEEIEIIRDRFEEFVLMVDDFKHPIFDYSYDRYSTGIELTLEYLLPRLANTDKLDFLFPIYPPANETGAKRGTLIVVPKAMSQRLLDSGIALMRCA